MYVGADYTLYMRTSEKQTGKLLSSITQQMVVVQYSNQE